tara:strand:+ start:182 stop:418 length:237 start_codon:yes stop_codon:yes gene_type:complete
MKERSGLSERKRRGSQLALIPTSPIHKSSSTGFGITAKTEVSDTQKCTLPGTSNFLGSVENQDKPFAVACTVKPSTQD